MVTMKNGLFYSAVEHKQLITQVTEFLNLPSRYFSGNEAMTLYRLADENPSWQIKNFIK